jgi:hypothetical protein
LNLQRAGRTAAGSSIETLLSPLESAEDVMATAPIRNISVGEAAEGIWCRGKRLKLMTQYKVNSL